MIEELVIRFSFVLMSSSWQELMHQTPGLEQRRLGPLLGSAWNNPMGDSPVGQRGPEELVYFSRITLKFKNGPSQHTGCQAKVERGLRG